jgi:hypothetical protein
MYQTLIHGEEILYPFLVADAAEEGSASLLSLDGRWFQCSVKRHRPDGPLWIYDCGEPIVGGMSGSPVVTGFCAAVIALISETSGCGEEEGDWQSVAHSLTRSLPGWLLRQFAEAINRS